MYGFSVVSALFPLQLDKCCLYMKSEDVYGLRSFSTMLDAMGSICRNRREAKGELKEKLGGDGEVFYEYTRPDKFQSRVF